MRIRRGGRAFADPSDSGALNDLAFLLIIYFIVIAGFQVHQGFLLSLPEKGAATWVKKDAILRVRLDAEGAAWIGEERLELGDLEKRMARSVAARPDLTVRLDIAPDAPYQAVVDAVGSVQAAKAENFSFGMEAESGSVAGEQP